MNDEARELTRVEHTSLCKLVVSMCANYDREYGCLPLEIQCYMFSKCWTGGYCKYFRKSVLPNNSLLEATLTGSIAPDKDNCAACGKLFIPSGRQAYCSDACASGARLKRQREYMRKKRESC